MRAESHGDDDGHRLRGDEHERIRGTQHQVDFPAFEAPFRRAGGSRRRAGAPARADRLPLRPQQESGAKNDPGNRDLQQLPGEFSDRVLRLAHRHQQDERDDRQPLGKAEHVSLAGHEPERQVEPARDNERGGKGQFADQNHVVEKVGFAPPAHLGAHACTKRIQRQDSRQQRNQCDREKRADEQLQAAVRQVHHRMAARQPANHQRHQRAAEEHGRQAGHAQHDLSGGLCLRRQDVERDRPQREAAERECAEHGRAHEIHE